MISLYCGDCCISSLCGLSASCFVVAGTLSKRFLNEIKKKCYGNLTPVKYLCEYGRESYTSVALIPDCYNEEKTKEQAW